MQRIFQAPEALMRAAAQLAACVDPEGLVVALVGPLGVGKTVFAKGLAEGLGIPADRVASPTFAIASQYRPAEGPLFAHVDVFRLASAAELDAAGFLDLLEPGNLVAVEWADRFPEALPSDHLVVKLARSNDGDAGAEALERHRVLNAVASGPVSRAALANWQRALASTGD